MLKNQELRELSKLLNFCDIPEKNLYYLVKRRLMEGISWDFKYIQSHPYPLWINIIYTLVDRVLEDRSIWEASLINPNFPTIFSEDKFLISFFNQGELISSKETDGTFISLRNEIYNSIACTKINIKLISSAKERYSFEEKLEPVLINSMGFFTKLKSEINKLREDSESDILIKNQRLSLDESFFVGVDDLLTFRYFLVYLKEKLTNEQLLSLSQNRAKDQVKSLINSQERFLKENWLEEMEIQELIEYASLLP